VKKLLVIRFSALGDVALLVPVVQMLAEFYPNWDITVLSRKMCEPLFSAMPENVHFVGADLKGRHHGRKGLETLLQEIDYRSFDRVADMHVVLRSFYLTMRMLFAGKRIAWIHKAHFSKWLMVHGLLPARKPLVTTYKRYQHAFNRLGFDIHISPTDDNPIPPAPGQQTLSPDSPLPSIGIAPFAAHRGKIYPLDKMEKVVEALSRYFYPKGVTVYLFGAGKEEQQILERWQHKMTGVVSLAGQHHMADEIAIMRRLKLLLTMDSANMHLASLAGTRVLSVWGATHPALGFLGFGQHRPDCIQRDLPCRPCSVFGKKPCKYGDYRCMEIPPQTIVERVKQAYYE